MEYLGHDFELARRRCLITARKGIDSDVYPSHFEGVGRIGVCGSALRSRSIGVGGDPERRMMTAPIGGLSQNNPIGRIRLEPLDTQGIGATQWNLLRAHRTRTLSRENGQGKNRR